MIVKQISIVIDALVVVHCLEFDSRKRADRVT